MTEIVTPFKTCKKGNDRYKCLQWFPDLKVSELFVHLLPEKGFNTIKTSKGLVELTPGDWVVWGDYTEVYKNEEFQTLFTEI